MNLVMVSDNDVCIAYEPVVCTLLTYGQWLWFVLSVLNFSDLYNMSCVLSEAGLASDAAFTVKEHFSTAPGLKSLSEVCTYCKWMN